MIPQNTRRLYQESVYDRSFDATVIEQRILKDGADVILDQTLFYPTSGGQPCDLGMIEGIQVLDVREQDSRIVHFLAKPIDIKKTVQGIIDWPRRFDFMQQHSGQHVLSQSFLTACGAKTIGFHLGLESSTIDLAVADLTDQQVLETEILANGVVYENRPVLIREIPEGEKDTVNWRREPRTEGPLRLVEIEGFDWTGCCGTHVRNTGEIGIIRVYRRERYKGGLRIHFLCGMRAFKDYSKKDGIVGSVSRLLTSGEEEVISVLSNWIEERKKQQIRMRFLLNAYLDNEASSWLADSATIGNCRVALRVFKDRDPKEIMDLVKRMIQFKDTLVLAAVAAERAYLVFGRSDSISLDMRPVMNAAALRIQGKGGGSAQLAQGSGTDASCLESVLSNAADECGKALSRRDA